MAARFELRTSNNGKHYFSLVANNGEVILTSQMYRSRAGARKGISSVQANSGSADRFQRRKGKSGKSHFVLRAANHRVIGSSQTYSSDAAMEKGIKAVMRSGSTQKRVMA